MKNTQRRYKVFLDTSSLLAGLNSPDGASGFIIALGNTNKINLIISREVLEEAERVVKNKLPALATPLLSFLGSNPLVTKKITRKELRSAYYLLQTEDAPILAGATKSKADFLVTLDREFERLATNRTKVGIITPGEFVRKYREGSL